MLLEKKEPLNMPVKILEKKIDLVYSVFKGRKTANTFLKYWFKIIKI